RELPSGDAELPAEPLRIEPGLEDREAPRFDARLRIKVDTEQSGVPARVWKERERLITDGPFDDRRIRRPPNVQPGDVADRRPRRMAGDEQTVGGTDGARQKREREHDGHAPGARHSGRCCRKNCSISSTSSDAGGKSLPPPGVAGSSSTSRDSSLRM